MSKTNKKFKKQSNRDEDYYKGGQNFKKVLFNRQSKQIDNLLKSKNVGRLLDLSDEKI